VSVRVKQFPSYSLPFAIAWPPSSNSARHHRTAWPNTLPSLRSLLPSLSIGVTLTLTVTTRRPSRYASITVLFLSSFLASESRSYIRILPSYMPAPSCLLPSIELFPPWHVASFPSYPSRTDLIHVYNPTLQPLPTSERIRVCLIESLNVRFFLSSLPFVPSPSWNLCSYRCPRSPRYLLLSRAHLFSCLPPVELFVSPRRRTTEGNGCICGCPRNESVGVPIINRSNEHSVTIQAFHGDEHLLQYTFYTQGSSKLQRARSH